MTGHFYLIGAGRQADFIGKTGQFLKKARFDGMTGWCGINRTSFNKCNWLGPSEMTESGRPQSNVHFGGAARFMNCGAPPIQTRCLTSEATPVPRRSTARRNWRCVNGSRQWRLASANQPACSSSSSSCSNSSRSSGLRLTFFLRRATDRSVNQPYSTSGTPTPKLPHPEMKCGPL